MHAKPITCPFCSLLCDDIKVTENNGQLKLTANGCERAQRGFEHPPVEDQPRVNGEPCSTEAAVTAAARILRNARQPLFSGLAVDVSGMRAVLSLADRSGAIVDHLHGQALMRNQLVLQDRGWITTTLTEVRNRADLVIFAGTDASNVPRFYERILGNTDSLFDIDISKRDFVYIGKGLKTSLGKRPDGSKPTHIRSEGEKLGEVIAAVRAIYRGHSLQSTTIAGVRRSALEKLANRLREARYAVVIWSAGELDYPNADHSIQAIAELVKDLNETTRGGGLSIGGDDGAISAMQTCTWQAGYPLRTSFATGVPVYNPARYASDEVLAHSEADAMLWVNTFSQGKQPPRTEVPTIVLAEPGLKLKQEPAVYLPVGTIGVDICGQVIRCDSVVSMRIKAARSRPLAASAQTLLSQIEKAL